MSTVLIYPDVEGALKTWLPTVDEIADIVSDRVFFTVPDKTDWPIIVINQVAAGPDGTHVPTSTPWIQLDCWAAPVDDGRKLRKKQASDLALVVCGAINGITSGTAAGSVRFLWARVLSSLPDPNPDTNQAKYAITVEISAASIAA